MFSVFKKSTNSYILTNGKFTDFSLLFFMMFLTILTIKNLKKKKKKHFSYFHI